jgi:hypothetical protein
LLLSLLLLLLPLVGVGSCIDGTCGTVTCVVGCEYEYVDVFVQERYEGLAGSFYVFSVVEYSC